MESKASYQWMLSRVYKEIEREIESGKRLIVSQGGTSSSKTYSAIQYIAINHLYGKVSGITSIVAESFPHLGRGAIRDFKAIMGPYFNDRRWHSTKHIYTFDRSQIEFFSADNSSKLRGGRRKRLFINEANNISGNSFDELDVRTSDWVIIDYNPTSEFWLHDKGLLADPSTHFIKSTYLDAKKVLPESTVAKIEARRERDPNWWNVYGLGELGNIEGLVYKNFDQIDWIPHGLPRFYGMDFGYSNDPTACVECAIDRDTLYCNLLIYETGLLNSQIHHRLNQSQCRPRYDNIWCDPACPKDIEELRQRGWNTAKSINDINAGIQKVNQYKIVWTKGSIQAIKEMRNYQYRKTMDDKITNDPVDDFNHAMDAMRYAVMGRTMLPQAQGLHIAR